MWTLLGALTVIGPLIAIARFISAYTQSCRIFNKTHTFPLPRRVIKEEAAEGAAYLAARKAAKAAEKAAFVGDTTIFGAFEEEAEIDEQPPAFEPAAQGSAEAVATDNKSANSEDSDQTNT